MANCSKKHGPEDHRSERVGWLRAAVLGANDGIVSTASLIVGVAAAHADHHAILLSGAAGLVAGAMSMAAGEYVSVSSQADTEAADLAIEKREIANNRAYEHEELAQIYVDRGLEPNLAREVAKQLMDFDALGSHARDELGITEVSTARPVQAAMASAASFTIGAGLPLLMVVFFPEEQLLLLVPGASLLFLIFLGMVSARAGGANLFKAAVRVAFWGSLAMIASASVGRLFGTAV